MLVELHEDCLECRLDDKWHQEEKRKEAERAEEDEESGCVEKLERVESRVKDDMRMRVNFEAFYY